MIFAIRVPTGFVRLINACACLSRTTHVLYSFCRTDVISRACTPPWQLGELHDPGPVYLDGSGASAANINPQAEAKLTAYVRPNLIASCSISPQSEVAWLVVALPNRDHKGALPRRSCGAAARRSVDQHSAPRLVVRVRACL